MKIAITNNRAGLVQIPHTKGEGPLNLNVGVNLVDVEVWQKCRDLAGVKAMMGAKVEVVRGRRIDPETVGKMQIVEGKAEIGDEGLKGVSPKAAAALIAEIFDTRLLERLAAEETRAPVKKVIAERLAALTPAEKKAG